MKYADLTEKIIGAAFKVHATLGNARLTERQPERFILAGAGVSGSNLPRALERELNKNNLNFCREFEMPVHYDDIQIGTRRVDFLVHDKISVELKAIIRLKDVHLAQAMNYLEAYNLEIGLLINFGAKSMEFKRLTNREHPSYESSQSR